LRVLLESARKEKEMKGKMVTLKDFPTCGECQDKNPFPCSALRGARKCPKDVWKEAFEKQLREIDAEIRDNPEGFYAEMDLKYPKELSTARCVLKEILGDEPK
jgi:hypothetical protein